MIPNCFCIKNAFVISWLFTSVACITRQQYSSDAKAADTTTLLPSATDPVKDHSNVQAGRINKDPVIKVAADLTFPVIRLPTGGFPAGLTANTAKKIGLWPADRSSRSQDSALPAAVDAGHTICG